MKKWIASILAVLLTSAGYVFVDQALIARVDTLEIQVSSLRDEINAGETTSSIPEPDAIYLKKYVIDILNSGTYTAEFAMTLEDAGTVPVKMYRTPENSEVNLQIGQLLAQELRLPGSITKLAKVRLIETDKTGDPKLYLAVPGGYCRLDSDDSEVKELLRETELCGLPVELDSLKYFGVNTYSGYTVEKYKAADDNTMYRFYFYSRGLSKMDVVDLETGAILETTPIRLSAGVTDRNAFKLTGREISIGEIETLFEDLAG